MKPDLKVERKSEVVTTTTATLKLTAGDIRRLLEVPEDAEVFITVPGGADWSNCDLHVQEQEGHEQALQVRWKRVKTGFAESTSTHSKESDDGR